MIDICISNSWDVVYKGELRDFVPDGNGAYPTSRVLSGSSDAAFAEEWEEYGKYKRYPAKLIYLFTEDDIKGQDEPSLFPWENAAARIILNDPRDDEELKMLEDIILKEII